MPLPLLPDTTAMGSVARDLRLRADDVRRRHAALAAQCARARWHSRAATACRRTAMGTLDRMLACARALDQSASALDQHARAVHERVRELETVPAGVAHAGTHLVHTVGTGLHRATHWMGV
jgi:hypothetical protein